MMRVHPQRPRHPLILGCAILLAGGAVLVGRGIATAPQHTERLTPLEELPVGTVELLEARPFIVDEPFEHEWRAEKPLERAGYLLVLKVEPELARPRQTAERVLYVGDQTAERCSVGGPTAERSEALWQRGILVVLVPSPLASDGRIALDLDTTLIWFGSAELPERVDAARVAAELAHAHSMGIGTVMRAAGTRVRHAAAEAIRVRNRWELEPYVQDLLQRY